MTAILKIEDVTYRYYQKFTAIEEVSLEVEAGELLAIVGANGSGKSTLLHVMDGLIYPDKGKVFYRNLEVSEKSLKDKKFLGMFRKQIGYIFQDPDIQLFCPTVYEELLYGPLQMGLSQKEAHQKSIQILNMLSISHLKDRPSYMLSGGEKKKVAIGSVLIMNPEVILFDEPTSGLDPRTQVFLVELLLSLHRAGKTIVVATHDLELVGEIATRVAVLSEEHRLVKIDSTENILSDQQLLLRVNLIHEHVHRHGEIIHRHLHFHPIHHQHKD